MGFWRKPAVPRGRRARPYFDQGLSASAGRRSSVLRAVVLAAGEGRRMRPLTETRPKPLLELAGATLIDHVLDSLRASKVTDIAVVVGHMHEAMLAHFESSPRGRVNIFHQERPRGTGDALLAAAKFVTDETLVVNADILAHPEDVQRVAQAAAPKAQVVMLTAEVRDPSRYGVVLTEGGAVARGDAQKVTALLEKPEKPPANRINAGVYRVTPDIIAALERTGNSARGEVELTSAIEAAAREGHAFAVAAAQPWAEVGRPWDLLAAQERLMATMRGAVEGEVEKEVHMKGAVAVAKGALVKSGTYIEGPAFIGPDARIGPNCYIRASTHIGASCHVGAATEVKNSVLHRDSNAPHHNYVGDSILGAHVNLGAGTKIANLRFDEGEVHVTMGGTRVSTGLRKFGAILGDGVKTGINASIDAGTILGPGVLVGPGARASGSIEAGARVM